MLGRQGGSRQGDEGRACLDPGPLIQETLPSPSSSPRPGQIILLYFLHQNLWAQGSQACVCVSVSFHSLLRTTTPSRCHYDLHFSLKETEGIKVSMRRSNPTARTGRVLKDTAPSLAPAHLQPTFLPSLPPGPAAPLWFRSCVCHGRGRDMRVAGGFHRP